jgi:hypothetical protein
MMRSAAGRESAAAAGACAVAAIAGAAGRAPQSAAQAMNTAARGLQNKGRAPSYLGPIKIAANLILLIQM